jgi:Ca2+-binding RTX toxin-like protein
MSRPSHSHPRATTPDGSRRRWAPIGAATLVAVVALLSAALGTAAAQEDPEPTPKCAGRAATIVAVEGAATTGTPGNDVIVGTAGDDVIFGRGGDDVICGLGGDDLIIAGPGSDLVLGGPGNDRLRGGAGNDVQRGGPGRDRIDGGPGRDRSVGGTGIDRCVGGPGADRSIGCDRLGPAARRPTVHAIGDSVLLGATDAYCAALGRAVPGIVEDAEVSRHFTVGIDLVAGARAATRGEMVFVVALGTNGPFADADLDALVAAAGRNSRLVFVNVHAPRDWEDTVNQSLADGVARHARRAVLVDWYGLAAEDRTLTGSDEIHLTCDGAATLAEAIADGVIRWS